MKPRILALAFLLIIVNLTYAQKLVETEVENVTKVTILNPGFSYETVIRKRQTIYLQAFMNTSAYFSYSDALGSSGGIFFDPALTAQYRYYYSYKNRSSKEKRTAMNSLNYIAPVWESIYSKEYELTSSAVIEDRRFIHKFGIVWGLQRNYKSRFSLDLNVGPGVVFGKQTTIDDFGQKERDRYAVFSLLGQINIGFWLNRRR